MRPARPAWRLLWAALTLALAVCGQNVATTSGTVRGGAAEDSAPEDAGPYADRGFVVFEVHLSTAGEAMVSIAHRDRHPHPYDRPDEQAAVTTLLMNRFSKICSTSRPLAASPQTPLVPAPIKE